MLYLHTQLGLLKFEFGLQQLIPPGLEGHSIPFQLNQLGTMFQVWTLQGEESLTLKRFINLK